MTMNHLLKLALCLGLCYRAVTSLNQKSRTNEDSIHHNINSGHIDDITIDDNWLNEVLNVNESSHKYNRVIIDQEPKTVQLTPVVSDDEDDNIVGSGSGETPHDNYDKANTSVFTAQKPGTSKPLTTELTNDDHLPNPVSVINLADNTTNKQTQIPPETTTAQPTTSTSSITATVSKKDMHILNVENSDLDAENDNDSIEDSPVDGSGSEDIVSDDEESLNITSATTKRPVSNCDGTSCKYGATCLVQNGVQTGCVCGMQCENFKGNPVCGSDGILYENVCHLQLESCSLQVNITMDTSDKCLKEDVGTTKTPLPQCQTSYPYWTPWSLWIQSGDQEFRFRYCKRSGPFVLTNDGCHEPQMQVRQCSRREKKSCRSLLGKTSKEYEYTCSGVELADTVSIDEVFPHLHDEVSDCTFSLYDISVAKYVHKSWTIDDLDVKGDKTIWCKNRDRFVPFYESSKLCRSTLEKFCTEPEKCNQQKKEKLKSKGNLKHNCWKKFLLGNELPKGFPGVRDKYFICQRFAREDSYLGSVSRKSFYGTVYDTKQRIPLMSFGRFRNFSDTAKPAIDFMIEKGLVATKKHNGVVSKVYNWINGEEKRGMYLDNSEASACNVGRFQAVRADYETPEYKIQQLLPYSLTGNDIREKIATYTLTNAAPMHASLQGMWESALTIVRNYAVNKCGIPVLLNPLRRPRNRVSRDQPELYVLSGVVSLDDADSMIGNGVGVPFLFWFAGCCIKGADTTSFALYARNVPDSVVISAPVAQLEILLSDIYNTTENEPIKLFPAYDDICGSIKSDVSGQIKL